MSEHSPQLENGYTRIANEWLEAFVQYPAPGTLKGFVLLVARYTWGYNETWRQIAVQTFQDVLQVSRQRVYQLRKQAAQFNLIEFHEGSPGESAKYRIQKDYIDWMEYQTKAKWTYQVRPLRQERPLREEHTSVGSQVRPLQPTSSTSLTIERQKAKDTLKKGKARADSDAAPKKEKELTPQQKAIETLWEAFGFDGKPGGRGYSGLIQLVQEHGLPIVEEYAAFIRRSPPQLPEGAKRQTWFNKQFRNAMNQQWKWKPEVKQSGKTIPARGDVDYGEPGRIKM